MLILYPFERFTESAKQALTLAQQESERSGQSYIGTEHILLALLQQHTTVANAVLLRLGVGLDVVRSRFENILGGNERMIIQQIIPTSRVKKVIEVSFGEARRSGHKFVGTEHLLLGLLIEGEGIAAHVLEDMGANLDVVRQTLAVVTQEGRVSDEGGVPPIVPPILSPSAARVMVSQQVSETHLMRALLRLGGRVTRSIRDVVVDMEHLRTGLHPPQRVRDLRVSLRDAIAEKRAAAARKDYQAAEAAQRREEQLREELKTAEAEWENRPDADT